MQDLKNKQITERDLYQMKIFDELKINENQYYIRVVGGWVFSGAKENSPLCFIPFEKGV